MMKKKKEPAPPEKIQDACDLIKEATMNAAENVYQYEYREMKRMMDEVMTLEKGDGSFYRF